MINGDFDGGGIEDLVVGYASPGGGALVLHRGNLDAFAPQSEAAFQAIAHGQFPPPFLAEAQVFDVPIRPDFIAAGDFSGNGRLDLVVASRGASALYILPNDGAGKFQAPQLLRLTGTVTALAAGNMGIGRALTNVLVGLTDPGNSFSLLVLGGTDFGLGAVATFPLSGPASNFSFGNLGDQMEDAAFLSGGQVVLLHSSSRQLENLSLPANASALALGSFIYDRNPQLQIALVDSTGSIQIAAHNEFDPHSYTGEELAARQRGMRRGWGDHLIADRAVPANGWKIVETIPPVTSFGSQTPVLLRTRITNHGADDLMVLGGSTGQMVVVFHPDTPPGSTIFPSAQISTRPYRGSPVMAITARVNVDGRPGVIALHSGEVVPWVTMPIPDPTFFVNRFDDPAPTSCRA
jgi:hypothetical protein